MQSYLLFLGMLSSRMPDHLAFPNLAESYKLLEHCEAECVLNV